MVFEISVPSEESLENLLASKPATERQEQSFEFLATTWSSINDHWSPHLLTLVCPVPSLTRDLSKYLERRPLKPRRLSRQQPLAICCTHCQQSHPPGPWSVAQILRAVESTSVPPHVPIRDLDTNAGGGWLLWHPLPPWSEWKASAIRRHLVALSY